MFFIVDACFFVMWFGAWSSCHGWGALGMSVLWTAVMGACFVTEAFGSLQRFMALSVNERRQKMLIAFAVIVWGLYFVGLGDWLNYLMPKTFPDGGVLFAAGKCGLVQCVIAIVWVVARMPFVKMMKGFYRLSKAMMAVKKAVSGAGLK